jgi:folate-binding protein YgfZ
MRTLPLQDVHEGRGATFGDEAGWTVPRAFGDVVSDVEVLHARAAVADVSHYGHFTLRGKESVRFLQGLVTNDVAGLSAGTGVYAAFLNVHGRIESDCWIFSFGDELVIQAPPERAEWVATSLGRFRHAGDFHLTSLESTHVALTLQGPDAARTLEGALGVEIGPFGPFECREVELSGKSLRILGTRRSAEWGADLLVPAELAASLYGELLEHGAAPIGADALDVVRMEAGLPRYGRDFDGDTVLQEVDVPEIVSFNKGCYLGQEVVARLHFLGQPAKLLRRLIVAGATLPEPGDEVIAAAADQSAGRVTSVALSPSEGAIVFAVVKRKHYAPGTIVRVRRGEAMLVATVAERDPRRAEKEPR